MRVLVTGGAGYLGACVVSVLLNRGHQVRVFDRFCFVDEALADHGENPNCEVLRGDIRRLQEHPGLLDGVETIVHLASLSNDPSCELDPEMTWDVNYECTRELASQAVQKGARRFVYASTFLVYGAGPRFSLTDESSPVNPVSPFTKSKYEAGRALLEIGGDHFEPVVARSATLFGWAPRMRFDLPLNAMVAQAHREGRVTLAGEGDQWRPFVHVRDAAQALVDIAEAPPDLVAGEVFNVGTDICNLRIRDLAGRVAQHFGNIPVESLPGDGEAQSYRVQFGKIRSVLGFKCGWSVEEGIQEMRERLELDQLDPGDKVYLNFERMKELVATPAGEGGEPVAARFIPLAMPTFGPEEEAAVVGALRSGWVTSGPNVAVFEQSLAERADAPHAVALSSCTAAIHLALVHAGVGPGDEVITPPVTWASTANTIVNMGATPVFVDVEEDTLNLDASLLEAAVTERTKAVIPVHMAGQPCDLDEVHEVARRHGLTVIEDAAHGLGADYRGRAIGACSPFSCFSFYASKNITTMEGGALVTPDGEAAEHIRLLAANGMGATAWQRYGRSADPAPPQVLEPGFKYLMNNVSAAMGVEQLKKFPGFRAARTRLAQQYRLGLADVDELEPLALREDRTHAWHLFIVRLKPERLARDRDGIVAALRRENVGTGVHFYGLHLHPWYASRLGVKPGDLPAATSVSRAILSLPLYPRMTEKNVSEVIEAVKKVLSHARKKA